VRLLIKILILLACVMAGTVWAGTREDFQKALSSFNSLSANTKRAALRSEWLAVQKGFEDIYKAAPKSEEAPKCLFYMGRSYEELAMRSMVTSDKQRARDAYGKLADGYPKHALAADAKQRMQKLQASAQAKPGTGSGQQEVSAQPKTESKSAENTNKNQKGVPMLRSVRHWSSDEYTRVVLDVSRDVTFTKALLGGNKQLQIELAGTSIAKDVMPSRVVRDGILSHIRVAAAENGAARITLDLSKMDHYRTFTLPDPYRLVVDVFGVDEKGKKADKIADDPVGTALKDLEGKKKSDIAEEKIRVENSKAGDADSVKGGDTARKSGPTEKGAKAGVTTERDPDKSDTPDLTVTNRQKKMAGSLVEQLGLTVRTVMIDAGHGGHDPGAMANGLKEKDINLKMAKALGKTLEAEGFNVVYTRTTDKFIPLEERTALANAKNADLFISVHCNSYKDESIKGLEVYYLNLASDAQAVRVAARENGVSVKKISDMQFILSDLMMNSKISESRDMASLIEQHGAMAARNFGGRGHGAKGAFFYVLTGARMPSILVELGYITNPDEAANFRSNEYLTSLAEGITRGVLAYKKKLERFAGSGASKS